MQIGLLLECDSHVFQYSSSRNWNQDGRVGLSLSLNYKQCSILHYKVQCSLQYGYPISFRGTIVDLLIYNQRCLVSVLVVSRRGNFHVTQDHPYFVFVCSLFSVQSMLFIFESSFQAECAPLYQAVHSSVILSLHLVFLCFQLVFNDTTQKGVTGISQIHFQLSVPKKSVLNFKCI